ncbi:SUKH-4 family immunity protein [Winogradskyella helgolandensis]|uniref:SUKH-4 family immunity protein n=1 Tax=Winogradskyella helgolandensis TaxID=2697010 RepID=UPI0015B96B84|nr:SUKH-4 family immunity protein [Winogradskyella helgolandensis]
MNDENFLNKWNKLELFKALNSSKNKFNLDQKSTKFLFDIGLPNDVLELSFDYLTEDLQTVNEAYKINDSNFDKYVCIGFNGSGDPIGLNIENREIAYLNHDDGFKEVYINGDIEKFARCGIEIIEFQNNLKKFRPESYFSTEFSDEELTQLQNKLTQIDNKIFDNDTHWNHTVEYWIWERQDERNKY